MRSKPHVSVWRNGFVNCRWGILKAGLGRLDRDYHGRRESDGTCLVSCARVSVRCLHLYGDYRCVPACLRLAVGYCLPVGVPVAFGLLFGSRKIAARNAERTKKAAVRVSDGIQEALENVREIRATNQEERYLNGLNQKIDEHERVTIQGELGTGLFVNAASVIMRLGVATTILVGRI